MKHLPISRPVFASMYENELGYLLESRVVTNHGPRVTELEAALAARLGVAHVVCTSSGTAALVVMLKALGVAGREVVVPSFTFCATAHAVVLAGAVPVFADANPVTWMLDPDDVARRLTPRTAAIMPVDAYGVPYPVGHLVGRYTSPSPVGGYIPVVCDSAPSFGATRASLQPSPRARAYSFHATKPFSTMEGGCVATDDAEFARRARHVAHFGIWPSGLAQVVGLNAHMLEISAMVGLKGLPELDRWLAVRKGVARRYAVEFDGLPHVTLPAAVDDLYSATWCYFPVLLANNVRRGLVAMRLRERGIETRPYYAPVHTMPAYKDPTVLPVTEKLADRVLALPVYSDQTEEETARVVDAVKEAVHG